jgi:uncharacterized RDD family membrane protein YckC
VTGGPLIWRLTVATQLGGGALLGAGLFTPLTGVIVVGAAATLVFVTWPHELSLYLLFAAVAIALTGGTSAVGVGAGLAAAVSIEAVRQVGRQRAGAGSATPVAEQENP